MSLELLPSVHLGRLADMKRFYDANNVVDVLWTSGWDSTFRVLYALIVESRVVRPHYLIDWRRKSTGIELARMAEIASVVAEKFPSVVLAPLIISPIPDLPAGDPLVLAYKRARMHAFLGSQYLWLAKYAETFPGIELCVHRDDRAYYFVSRLENPSCPNEFARLFGGFSFPVIGLTKAEMRDIARQVGFLDILERSWFCHDPLPSGDPCGLCNPCCYAIEEGMEYRVGHVGRRNHRFRWILRPARKLLLKTGDLVGLSWRGRGNA